MDKVQIIINYLLYLLQQFFPIALGVVIGWLARGNRNNKGNITLNI